ncbi:MAG: RDD family protein [Sulfuricurvum sp.]|uniref:RDD family protein n=1 Tax=Sulfuricurvum sp. TaxID=2025608 RepID=UPI0026110325|nr:RDD family protein [Sulfuricurvum sp.]MDD2839175.1 RDD family protein [Sulfuricurvum sp.]MDD3597795.1 RDD family protein [Sulfuricurvum sp.]MDD4883279.1 RDD family protein [Sulfuricurvum sp.]
MRWRTLKKKQHTKPAPSKPKIEYAPFWPRALGFVTDIFMIGLPISLLMMMVFGYDQMHTATAIDVIVHTDKAHQNPPNPIASLTQIALFMITYVWLWHRFGQTPGKKLAFIRVVDAVTLENAPYWKLILRFIGYFVSLITVFGFFIGSFRKDKRTLHDLLSGTAVIRIS